MNPEKLWKMGSGSCKTSTRYIKKIQCVWAWWSIFFCSCRRCKNQLNWVKSMRCSLSGYNCIALYSIVLTINWHGQKKDNIYVHNTRVVNGCSWVDIIKWNSGVCSFLYLQKKRKKAHRNPQKILSSVCTQSSFCAVNIAIFNNVLQSNLNRKQHWTPERNG